MLRLITYVLAFGYFAFEFYLLIGRRAKGNSAKTDRGTIRWAWGLILFGLASGFLIGRWLKFLNWPMTSLVVIWADGLLVFGIILRVWSIWHLGRFFTVQVSLRDDHTIVDTGPYRYVRHPSYTGSLLAFTGIGLLTFNYVGCLLVIGFALTAYLLRIRVEEQVLSQHFGAAYKEYVQRTKRLVPGIY